MIFMGEFNTKCMYQDAILENIVHQLFWFLESSPTNISDFFFFKYIADIVWLAYLSVCWPWADLWVKLHTEEGFALMHNPLKE